MERHPILEVLSKYEPTVNPAIENTSLLMHALKNAEKEFYYEVVDCTRYLFLKSSSTVGQVPTNIFLLYLTICGVCSKLPTLGQSLRYNIWYKEGQIFCVEHSVHRAPLLWFLQAQEVDIQLVTVLWVDVLREEKLVWNKLNIPPQPEKPTNLPHRWSLGVSTSYCPYCLYSYVCGT
jgi:hypothetical protein